MCKDINEEKQDKSCTIEGVHRMYFNIEVKDTGCHFSRGIGLSAVPHIHEHIEVVYFLDGSSLCCADKKEAIGEKGDIFISFPNQIHHYHDIVAPDHYILIFSPDLCREFSSVLSKGTPVSPIIKNADKNGRIKSIIRGIEATKENEPFSQIKNKAHILLLLSELLAKLEMETGHNYDEDTLKKVITYCYENYQDDISLSDVASELGVSRYYISHIFNNKLKTGFKEYVNRLRIQAACEMLRSTDKNITEIAYDSGFGTARSFNRSFFEFMNQTPKEYRNSYHGINA